MQQFNSSRSENAAGDNSERGRSGMSSAEQRIMRAALLALSVIFVVFMVCDTASTYKLSGAGAGDRIDLTDISDKNFRAAVNQAVGDIVEIAPVYVLPLEDKPAPVPDPDNFFKTKEAIVSGSDPVSMTCYEDETIHVKCWKEKISGTTANFVDVQIEHPSQFRRAFAGGSFESRMRYTPQAIAQQNNAVVAMSADYFGYRDNGIIIHHGEVKRNVIFPAPRTLDILLFDSNGDMHTSRDYELESSGILEDYDIVYSFAFGPTIVSDGVVAEKEWMDNYTLGESARHEPRAAIGQLGTLHYLLCTIDGRTERIASTNIATKDFKYSGMTVAELAQVMKDKGCTTAYTMDGGQTATIVIGGNVFNTVAYGGQREVTDILYFATGIPEN